MKLNQEITKHESDIADGAGEMRVTSRIRKIEKATCNGEHESQS